MHREVSGWYLTRLWLGSKDKVVQCVEMTMSDQCLQIHQVIGEEGVT